MKKFNSIKELPATGYVVFTSSEVDKYCALLHRLILLQYRDKNTNAFPEKIDTTMFDSSMTGQNYRVTVYWDFANSEDEINKFYVVTEKSTVIYYKILLIKFDDYFSLDDDMLEKHNDMKSTLHFRNYWTIDNVKYWYGRQYEFHTKFGTWTSGTLIGVNHQCTKFITEDSGTITLWSAIREIVQKPTPLQKEISSIISKYGFDNVKTIVNNFVN